MNLQIRFWVQARNDAETKARRTRNKAERKAWNRFVEHADKRLNKRMLDPTLALLPSFRGLAAKEAQFDGPETATLLNCRNGTVDLKTGELRPHRREDYITLRLELDYDSTAVAVATEVRGSLFHQEHRHPGFGGEVETGEQVAAG
jgi:putative DNA primase/helicase